MLQSPSSHNPTTVDQLLALNVRLAQQLMVAGVVRTRLLAAAEANRWPNLLAIPLLPTVVRDKH